MVSRTLAVDAVVQPLVESDRRRTVILVNNIDAVGTLYIGRSSSISAVKSIVIPPGNNIIMEMRMGWETNQEWYILSSGPAVAGILTEQFQDEYTTPQQPLIVTPPQVNPTPITITPTPVVVQQPERGWGWG